MNINIPTSLECQFLPPHLIGSHAATKFKIHISHKIKHFQCLKDLYQLRLVKTFLIEPDKRLPVLGAMPARPLIQTTLGNTYTTWICVSRGTAVPLLSSGVIWTLRFISVPQARVNLVLVQAATPWKSAIKWSLIAPSPVSGFTFREPFLSGRTWSGTSVMNNSRYAVSSKSNLSPRCIRPPLPLAFKATFPHPTKPRPIKGEL